MTDELAPTAERVATARRLRQLHQPLLTEPLCRWCLTRWPLQSRTLVLTHPAQRREPLEREVYAQRAVDLGQHRGGHDAQPGSDTLNRHRPHLFGLRFRVPRQAGIDRTE